MSTTEAEFSRRDLFLAFAGKGKSKAKKPSRSPGFGKAPTPEPPNWGGIRLTHRQFVAGLAGTIGLGIAGTIGLWKSWEQHSPIDPEKPKIAPELEKLGQELRQWKLQDGRLMTNLFTEVLLTADLLQVNLDPRTILPQFKSPLIFSKNTPIGGANLSKNTDSNDPRKVGIYKNGELLYSSGWLAKDMSVELMLSPDILSSEARLYIIVKEATQLIYRQQYLKLYIDLLKSGGTITFQTTNPTNIPTSEAEQLANFGVAVSNFERSNYGYSSLDDFIDVGTRLQTAPIGATQRLDRNRRNQSFGNPHWSQVEQSDTDFLRTRHLLKENDGIITWAKPFVINEDFFKLFADYVKPLNHPVLILPKS